MKTLRRSVLLGALLGGASPGSLSPPRACAQGTEMAAEYTVDFRSSRRTRAGGRFFLREAIRGSFPLQGAGSERVNTPDGPLEIRVDSARQLRLAQHGVVIVLTTVPAYCEGSAVLLWRLGPGRYAVRTDCDPHV